MTKHYAYVEYVHRLGQGVTIRPAVYPYKAFVQEELGRGDKVFRRPLGGFYSQEEAEKVAEEAAAKELRRVA